MGIRRLVLVAALLGGPVWAEEEAPPAPAAPARVVLGFDIAVDGRLTVDAAGGPLRLGSLFGGSPPGDALEAVRSVLRAAATGRRAAGADGLSGATMEVRVHPTVRWRPVEWLVRVARESDDRPGRLRLVVREPDGRAQGVSFRASAAPAGAVRAVLSRAQGKDAGASLLSIGEGRWVLPPLAQHAEKRAARLGEATKAAAAALAARPGGFVEVEVTPDAAALTPVADVLDTLTLFAQARPAPVEFVFDPSPLPGRSDKPPADVPEAAFASLPALEPFDAFRIRRRPWPVEGKISPVRAVGEALRWLAGHQAPDGRWGAESFASWSDGKPIDRARRPEGLGNPAHDVGVSGLALCAFLGAGYTDRGEGAYATTVRRGLARLLLSQRSDGSFADVQHGEGIYDHATAALAVVEAYGMTGDSVLRGAAQRALDLIALARNPYFAWRHGVKPGDNDTSVTAWMVAVLRSARLANEESARRGDLERLVLDGDAWDGAKAWIDKMTDPDFGRVGFAQRGSGPLRPPALVDRYPSDRSEAMTAAGFCIRLALGEDPRTSEPMVRGLDLMAHLLPSWNPNDGSIDLVYWYWGSLATFQAGGDRWKRWNDALQTAVVANQRMDTDPGMYRGSWDPIDVWGREGGRVYSTAMGALILETPTRYERTTPAK